MDSGHMSEQEFSPERKREREKEGESKRERRGSNNEVPFVRTTSSLNDDDHDSSGGSFFVSFSILSFPRKESKREREREREGKEVMK